MYFLLPSLLVIPRRVVQRNSPLSDNLPTSYRVTPNDFPYIGVRRPRHVPGWVACECMRYEDVRD